VALAAERVSVSSPSISAAIGQLEDAFGLQLFVCRHAQGLSLTEGGRQFLATAREVLRAANQLADSAAAITGVVAGPLSVGCLQTFAQVLLPQLRRGFADRFPDGEFHQHEGEQAELLTGCAPPSNWRRLEVGTVVKRPPLLRADRVTRALGPHPRWVLHLRPAPPIPPETTARDRPDPADCD
jgi:DNA-binding transcriptional LysR family regulator